jgi:hypothetical protein
LQKKKKEPQNEKKSSALRAFSRDAALH